MDVRTIALCALWVIGAALGGPACVKGGSASNTDQAGDQAVEYRRVQLSSQQSGALTDLALSRMTQGRVPEDVAMVVTPQPADLPKGTVLVAVQFGSCGHSLGRARIENRTLVIEKERPDGAGPCAGMIEFAGLVVSTPADATIEDARVEAVA